MSKIWKLLLFLALVACKNDNAIKVEQYNISLEDENVKTTVAMEYPLSGNKTVLPSVRKHVAALLIPNYNGDLNNANQILQQFATVENAKLQQEEKVGVAPYTYDAKIKMLAQTSTFITFEKSAYTYVGGAHGTPFWQAITVNKNDGKLLNDEILNDKVKTKEFKQLLKQGVAEYFSFSVAATYKCEFNQAQLADMLFNEVDANNLPLPAGKPFLTQNGVGFAYMQYEIACYAAGKIAFVIPYEKMRPYMSEKVWNLVKNYQGGASKTTAYVNEYTNEEYQKYMDEPEHKPCDF